MEIEIRRIRCVGDDGAWLTVVEYRHRTSSAMAGRRRELIGAGHLALATGEPVRYIDPNTFEVLGSGELLRRL